MIENINLNGATVTAELHGYMYDGIYKYHGVFDFGNKISHTVVSNNEITLADGLLCNQGRFMRIVGAESIAIENGKSGVNRVDLIVAHFETDGINETHDIRVLKGDSTGEVPTHSSDDIYNGGTSSDLVLYKVTFDGLNIDKVEAQFDLLPALSGFGDLQKDVEEVNERLTTIEGKTSEIINKNVRGTQTANGTYIKFAQIKNVGTYVDVPLLIEITQRTYRAGEISIVFKNSDTTDPSLLRFSVRAWSGCDIPEVYIHKSASSTWDLYIHKPSNYDWVTIHRLVESPYLKDWRLDIEWLDEEATTLPDGYIAATKEPSMVVMSETEYTALSSKDSNTLYFLTE